MAGSLEGERDGKWACGGVLLRAACVTATVAAALRRLIACTDAALTGVRAPRDGNRDRTPRASCEGVRILRGVALTVVRDDVGFSWSALRVWGGGVRVDLRWIDT